MQYRFLIYISYSYSIPVGEPLEKEILKLGHIVQWFADEDEGALKIKDRPNTITNIKKVIDYKPHIVLTATNMVPDFVSGLKVQVFHGFLAQKRPSKKHIFSEFRIRGFFDLYCTQGPSTTSIFKQLEKKHGHFKVIETGWSKVDPLFPVTETTQKAIPTIMIASTFTERLSLAYDEDVFQEIKRLATTGKYNFKMVLHPKIPQHIIEKWKTLEGNYFTYHDTTNLIPIFRESTVLFADTTSAIQEFLLQKKPVVTYKHTFPHPYLIHTSTANTIDAKLTEALSPSQSLLDNISEFIVDLHPFFDGASSQRIIETCISYVLAPKKDIKNRPFNFIRKFKIRKRLGHFTFKSYNKPYVLKKE